MLKNTVIYPMKPLSDRKDCLTAPFANNNQASLWKYAMTSHAKKPPSSRPAPFCGQTGLLHPRPGKEQREEMVSRGRNAHHALHPRAREYRVHVMPRSSPE